MHGEATEAIDHALRDFDVHWERPPIASQLFRLAIWLDGWHHAWVEQELPSLKLGQLDPSFSASWSWLAVYQGNKRVRAEARSAVETLYKQLDAWASPFIASRDQPY
jgi:hypothetical protein